VENLDLLETKMRSNSLFLTLAMATLMVGAFIRPAQATPPADPSFDLTWTLGATIPNVHQEGAVAVVGSKIYVISGEAGDCSDDNGPDTVTRTVDIYDTASDTFAPGPPVNIGRTEAPLAVTVGNSIYLMGGYVSCNGLAAVQVEKLDLNTNTWSVLGPGSNLPAPLDGYYHCGAAVGSKIYYFEQQGIGVFDTTTNTWNVLTASPLLTPSYFCRATAVAGQIVITGPGLNGSNESYAQRILVFDTNTGNMTKLPAITVPLAEHAAALLLGSVVVAGGDYNLYSVQAISNPICRVCIGANSSLVRTLTPLPVASDDAVGAAVGNVFYILGGNSNGNNLPPVLIGKP
jgi:Kelch motif